MSTQNETDSKKFERELERMYARTEHWISDYEFFADELAFLNNLVDKYFVGAVLTDETDTNLKTLVRRLLQLDESRKQIDKANRENLTYLSRLIQNKELFDPEECRDRQSDLESDQLEFLKRYRTLKKEIFQAADQLLTSARSKRLIG